MNALRSLHTNTELSSKQCMASSSVDDTTLFDKAADKYVKETLNDCDLFNMGPYNNKQRTGGVNYKALALLAMLVEFLLSWCPQCKADNIFSKEKYLVKI